MIKKWLLILRDFSHIFLKKQNKTEQTPYAIFLYAIFAPNYITIFAVLGGLVNRMGFNLNLFLRNNEIILLLFTAIMFGSFVPLTMWIVKWLKPIPLPDALPKRKYRWYAVIFLLTFLMGFVLLPVVINTFNYIWPPTNFSGR